MLFPSFPQFPRTGLVGLRTVALLAQTQGERLGKVKRCPAAEIGNLVAAACAACHDDRVLSGDAHSGQESILANRAADRIVILLVAEIPRQTAATAWQKFDGITRCGQRSLRGCVAHQRARVAVTVEQRARRCFLPVCS